jgi:hypothetical protein
MTTPAEVLLSLYQKVFILSTMGIMAIRTQTFFERIMYKILFQRLLNPFMTAQTERVNALFHQSLDIARMCIMAGDTLAVFKWEMDITTGKAIL